MALINTKMHNTNPRADKATLAHKVVAVTVAAAATSGSSAADSELVGGQILGYYSTGNQDQLVEGIRPQMRCRGAIAGICPRFRCGYGD